MEQSKQNDQKSLMDTRKNPDLRNSASTGYTIDTLAWSRGQLK